MSQVFSLMSIYSLIYLPIYHLFTLRFTKKNRQILIFSVKSRICAKLSKTLWLSHAIYLLFAIYWRKIPIDAVPVFRCVISPLDLYKHCCTLRLQNSEHDDDVKYYLQRPINVIPSTDVCKKYTLHSLPRLNKLIWRYAIHLHICSI